MQNPPPVIEDAQTLRRVYDKPASSGAVRKCLGHLDAHARQFIGLSPFLVLATSDGEASADISPRGGCKGHVIVLDEHHVLLPDRAGNNRLDSFNNILRFPYVALLFFIPGMAETLRVNGRASICTRPDLLAQCGGEKLPKAGLLVEVNEMFLHCSRSAELASLWEPASWPDTAELPSPARIFSDHIRHSSATR